MPLRRSLLIALGLLLCVFLSPFALAQGDSVRPTGEPGLQLFGGYSSYHPGGTLENKSMPNLPTGVAGQVIYPTTPYASLLVDFEYQNGSNISGYSFGAGFRLHRRIWNIVPFAEVMIGAQHLSQNGYTAQTNPSYQFGAGVEYKVSPRLTIRPIEIVALNTYYNPNTNQSSNYNYLNGYRVQSGVVYGFRLPPPPPVSAACSATPEEVDAGSPIKLSVVVKGFLPKRSLKYSYTSTTGSVSGDQNGATVDTTGASSGSQTVTATIKDNGHGKQQRSATCEASFKIKEQLPPTLSVSADPGSLHPGEAATISASGSSPDGRPLTYNCIASAGKLIGSADKYTLDTAGIDPSTVAITCTATDDRMLATKASTIIQISAKASQQEVAKVTPSHFGATEFRHDTKRPTRVDNEAKGELDRFADALSAAADVKAVLVGYASLAEEKDATRRTTMAAQRVINSKDYLTSEKGIDPVRIEVRTAEGDAQKVELWLVPAGASFNTEGTATVDEAKIKAIPRKPLPTKAGTKPAHATKPRQAAKPVPNKNSSPTPTPAEPKPTAAPSADSKPATKAELRHYTLSLEKTS